MLLALEYMRVGLCYICVCCVYPSSNLKLVTPLMLRIAILMFKNVLVFASCIILSIYVV